MCVMNYMLCILYIGSGVLSCWCDCLPAMKGAKQLCGANAVSQKTMTCRQKTRALVSGVRVWVRSADEADFKRAMGIIRQSKRSWSTAAWSRRVAKEVQALWGGSTWGGARPWSRPARGGTPVSQSNAPEAEASIEHERSDDTPIVRNVGNHIVQPVAQPFHDDVDEMSQDQNGEGGNKNDK